MSHAQPSSQPRRNYASISEYYEPDGPPIAWAGDDGNGVLIRTSPFGKQGPLICITLERWLEWTTTVKSTVDEYFSSRRAPVVAQ